MHTMTGCSVSPHLSLPWGERLHLGPRGLGGAEGGWPWVVSPQTWKEGTPLGAVWHGDKDLVPAASASSYEARDMEVTHIWELLHWQARPAGCFVGRGAVRGLATPRAEEGPGRGGQTQRGWGWTVGPCALQPVQPGPRQPAGLGQAGQFAGGSPAP